MKYLVDADVLGEPTKPSPSAGVVAWLRKHEPALVLSAITVGEVRCGIERLPAGKKREQLRTWFAGGVERLPILDFDAPCAEAWARLLAKLRRAGNAMPIKDSLIAATAKRHGLVIATHNTIDFRNAGVKLMDPFEG